MTAIKQQTTEEKIQQATIELRRKTLANGLAFMYFLDSLPEDYIIYEYPDGRFQVEQVRGVNDSSRFVRMATSVEISQLNEHQLDEYYTT